MHKTPSGKETVTLSQSKYHSNTHWVSTSCCWDWQLVIASCGVKAYVSTLNALLLFTHPHENPLHPTPHFQAEHPESSPIFIQQIFICADRGPGIVLSMDKEMIIKKRGPTPDIMELQFREGVRQVNQVTAYLLNYNSSSPRKVL